MIIPEGLFYTKEHEWVKIETESAVIGISDYAQHSLGDITFVELPEIGSVIVQGSRFASVESVKAASEVYAPVSGEIVKINQDIVNAPELINQSPYEKAWFAVVRVKDISEKDNLMNASDYKKYTEGIL
jgi:glycine cleavage system H protein